MKQWQNKQPNYKCLQATTSRLHSNPIIWQQKHLLIVANIRRMDFAQNPFFGYLPQAIGVFIAKLLDLNVIWMLWLASICNLVVYSAIVSFAIRKTPIFKVPLFVTACIPLAVFQAASPSIDSIIYSVSILLIAYFFYLYKLNDCTINIKHITKFMALVLFLGMCKLTLFSFVLLIFAVPLKNFKNRNMLIYSIGGIVILVPIGLCIF